MIKNILSYIWPQTKKKQSDFSGEIELTVFQGKKMLDTKNANYSFGSQQVILEKGLAQIDFSSVNSILLLGLGAGSTVFSIRNKFNNKAHIDAVEIDQKIIDIAFDEFNIGKVANLSVFNEDAFDFMQRNKKHYDLIIVDIFIDTKVPEQFYSEQFATLIANALNKNGTMVNNLGIDLQSASKAWQFVQYFKNKGFKIKLIEKVARYNTVFIAHTK